MKASNPYRIIVPWAVLILLFSMLAYQPYVVAYVLIAVGIMMVFLLALEWYSIYTRIPGCVECDLYEPGMEKFVSNMCSDCLEASRIQPPLAAP